MAISVAAAKSFLALNASNLIYLVFIGSKVTTFMFESPFHSPFVTSVKLILSKLVEILYDVILPSVRGIITGLYFGT